MGILNDTSLSPILAEKIRTEIEDMVSQVLGFKRPVLIEKAVLVLADSSIE